MSPLTSCSIIFVAVFAAGVWQGETLSAKTVSVGDAIYNQFASMIEFEEQLAQVKLNFVVNLLVTELASAPTDKNIETTLDNCFSTAVEQNPTADADCVQDLVASVNQTIYDSQQQLGFCANLTHGWLVAKGQLPQAYVANATLSNIVDQILTRAQKCARRFAKNPGKEYNCMLKVQQQYNDAWQNATSVIHSVYDMLSGVSLLVELNVQDCLNLEDGTLQAKCDGITADVVACTQNTTRHTF